MNWKSEIQIEYQVKLSARNSFDLQGRRVLGSALPGETEKNGLQTLLEYSLVETTIIVPANKRYSSSSDLATH